MSEPLRYQNPELQDLLASNYVMGTLRGPARKRFESLMSRNESLVQRVRQWQEKMQPLHEVTPEVAPKKATWQKILGSINQVADPMIEKLLSRLRFYKALSTVAFTCALMIAVVAYSPWFAAKPTAAAINYVAVLKNNEATPTMVVTLTKAGRVLRLDMLQKPEVPADRKLQLWAISREDGSTESLGTIGVEKQIETNLSKAQWGLIKNAEYLIVSVEEQDAAAPSALVIAKGLCVKVEGWKSGTG